MKSLLLAVFVLCAGVSLSQAAALPKERVVEAVVDELGLVDFVTTGEVRVHLIEETDWPKYGEKYKGKAWLIAADWVSDPPETQHHWVDRESGELLETT